MVKIWTLIFFLGVSNSLKLLEKREIETSNGKKYTCQYTFNYNGKGVVNKKKTTIACNPSSNGGTAIEVFDLPNVGKVSVKHTVKKGKGTVQDFSPYSEPASNTMPMNCSCKVPFPTEMMEMMSGSEMTTMPAGRKLAPMLMTHDGESNRKVLKVERGLNRVGPILLLLLLPQIIAAIQAALAGRSLEINKEELAEKFNRQLFGNGGLGNGALLGALTGGNNAGLTGGLGGGLGGLTGGGLLGGLTGGNTGDNGAVNPADLAGIISSLSSGGNPADLLSNPAVQQLIQQVIQQQMEEFLSNGGPEQLIGQVMSMSDEEIMAMIMPYIPEDMQGMMQQVAQMTDEEFMQHMMEQMGMNEMFGGGLGAGMGFNMTDIIQEWEAPFDVYCDCLPTSEEHGTMK